MSQIRHQPVAPTHAVDHRAGDTIDRHRHDEHQIVYVSAGVIAIETAQGSWVGTPERAVWIPAGVWHEHRFYGLSSMHTVGFPAGRAPLPDSAPTVLAVTPLVRELLVACTAPDLPPAEERRIRSVLNDRLRRADVRPLVLPVARDPRLAEACALVTADLSTVLSLDALAVRVGLGARTLSRLFRTELGTTYPQWRTQVRVFHALVQLAQGESVTTTAHRCGFATSSAFVDTFARTMGTTPGAFRARAGGSVGTADGTAGRILPHET